MATTSVTKEQILSALQTIKAVAETVRELGEVPSGVLYAQLMGVMGLSTYSKIIEQLKKAGLVSEKAHLLTWTGPN